MRTERTDVLVVGAGPVGLFSALQLASQDIDVIVIDRESGPAARSYACVLHQSTLGLLDQHGLIDEAIEVGQRIDTVGFYDENRLAPNCIWPNFTVPIRTCSSCRRAGSKKRSNAN